MAKSKSNSNDTLKVRYRGPIGIIGDVQTGRDYQIGRVYDVSPEELDKLRYMGVFEEITSSGNIVTHSGDSHVEKEVVSEEAQKSNQAQADNAEGSEG